MHNSIFQFEFKLPCYYLIVQTPPVVTKFMNMTLLYSRLGFNLSVRVKLERGLILRTDGGGPRVI